MTEIPASSPHTLPPASPSSSSTLATTTAAAVAAPVLSPSSSFLDADKKAQHSSKLAFPTFVQVSSPSSAPSLPHPPALLCSARR
jgi:hypothetical protein